MKHKLESRVSGEISITSHMQMTSPLWQKQRYGFSNSYVWMWELDHKEGWVLKNRFFATVVLEKTPESLLDSKEIKTVSLKKINPECSLAGLILKLKLQYFLATWCKVSTHCKKPWWWERLWAGGEWGDRGWDGWMASLTQWTWVCANSRRQWRTGKPGMLQFMVLQRVRHNWLTEHMHPHTF